MTDRFLDSGREAIGISPGAYSGRDVFRCPIARRVATPIDAGTLCRIGEEVKMENEKNGNEDCHKKAREATKRDLRRVKRIGAPQPAAVLVTRARCNILAYELSDFHR